ncbi:MULTISPECIES: RNA-guided endonuclease TnpB family protein [unclassified Bacillus (in: firmicutes)]|uniref:RNA-guided endonuclease InsQ/TnpB family protein n=1 Tax=unclassified Bacillus (in: firmicutes) TaxID=185979 RepID=UPI0008E572C8|nr:MULTISPECIES: RNA-guided endonuclease TnpB family protein [unclassified Bacillus (in: firmicutes)]SFI10774.1 putative transposase [Bacillus sp. 71mf]SFS76210.1 putative transposase [Bacillus sp. 103mf]
MIRASYFIFKPNNEVDRILIQLGYAARKLWNVANYEKMNWNKESNAPFPDWYDQKKRLKKHFWYKNLPSQSAQEVLKVLQEAWVSFFELKKSGGIESPKPPRFKQKNVNVKFLNNGFCLDGKNLRLSIPAQQKAYLKEKYNIKKKFIYIPVPTHIKLGVIKTVEVKLISDGEYKIILAQEYPNCSVYEKSDKCMAIDIGVANALTCYDYRGHSHIISGRQWLSVERYFHKKIAHYQAISDAQQSVKGIEYPKKSKRVLQLYKKKRAQTFHILHCMTKRVVDIAVQQGVETIVIGDISGIREKANLGKKNNQKFHALPFLKMVQMITYKAEEKGIAVQIIKEDYTSQVCSICKPIPSKEHAKKGNRRHRGLYVCEECKTVINADVNGAINICKRYLKELNVQSVVVLDTPNVYTFNGQQFVA